MNNDEHVCLPGECKPDSHVAKDVVRGNTEAARFNTTLRGWILSRPGVEIAKGGIAFRAPNGVEIETGYSLGEVRLKIWDPQGVSLFDVNTIVFSENTMEFAKKAITEAIETGRSLL